MIGPVSHITGIEGRTNDVEDVRIEAAEVRREVNDLAQVLVANEGGCCAATERKIHVPRKGQHFAIGWAKIHEEVMIVTEGITIADATESDEREGPHPFVNIHDIPRLAIQCC